MYFHTDLILKRLRALY